MGTINYFVGAKKRELAPIYIRFSAGRGVDLIVKSGLFFNPARWSNDTHDIRQRIGKTQDEEQTLKKLSRLKEFIESEYKIHSNYSITKEWLADIVFRFHNNRSADAKDLNGYIDQFIKDAQSGNRKNKSAMNLATGTIKAWKVFQRNFNEYQGTYTDKRLGQIEKENEKRQKEGTTLKKLRPKRLIDFAGITIDFYHAFVRYLTDEGFGRGTIGRHIKELKMFMNRSLEDGLHENRQFEYSAFKKIVNESFSVYLTKSELEKIVNIDLSDLPDLDIARDAFLVLCETALRVSDYKKVDVNIRESEDGTKLIYITQTKTGGTVVIPLSERLERILKKYNGSLPKIPDQFINRDIKKIAQRCGINEVLRYEIEKYGKRFEKTVEKWQLVTCHTGRRTACSLMYLAGIPPISIMQISGHKSEKTFLKYIKVTPEENARKLANHPYFRGISPLKVAN